MSAKYPSPTELAAVLVRISRECGAPVEHLRAEQLLRDARVAWPGEESELWITWIAEVCRSLDLRAREAELTVEEAHLLAEDGGVVVGAWRSGYGPIVLISEGDVAEGEIDQRLGLSNKDLAELSLESGGKRWLVVEHAERVDANQSPRLKSRPISRLALLLRPEWRDIWTIGVFAFVAGLLSLSTPIAVEALVNTVAFGQLLQPVVVLAAMLFGFLAFAALMQAMQAYVAEIIQRRLFARVAADLAHRLPSVDHSQLNGEYGPELANRFLDVVTLQKVVAQVLLDGISIVLTTLVGMTVLAFYHPWLLGFDVLLLAMVIGGLLVMGRGAIRSSIDESKYKYQLTSWLQDSIRCETAFKPAGGAEFVVDRANLLTTKYLDLRRAHFSVLFRQILFVLGLQAVAGTILLGGGGWLVIQGQLSLGQLVAAELIVSTILSSFTKLGKHLEGFYDAVAAIDKLGILFDLPTERHDGLLVVEGSDGGLEVALKEVTISGAHGRLDEGLTLRIDPGRRLAILGPAGSGKSALCSVLYAAAKPQSGRVTVAGVDPADVRPDVLRGAVSLVNEIEVFEGTIAENVHLHRRGVGTTECRAALEVVGVLDMCLALEEGIDTPLTASGWPLSRSQQRLLMLARGIAGVPQLLIIDGLLDSMPDAQLDRALTAIMAPHRQWTVVVATGRRDVAERLDQIVELDSERPISEAAYAGDGGVSP
jgi:putative ABC transport system ATP-binding protein